jgi:hypothetical protein
MPRRSELDPAALRHALPDLLIIDVTTGAEPGSHVFTYRLTGTRVDNRLGLSLKGRTVATALLGDAAPAIQKQYETVVAQRRPLVCTHCMVVGGARHVEYERLAVPLAGQDDSEIVALVAAVDFACSYPVKDGKPIFCRDPAACRRLDLCVPGPDERVAEPRDNK